MKVNNNREEKSFRKSTEFNRYPVNDYRNPGYGTAYRAQVIWDQDLRSLDRQYDTGLFYRRCRLRYGKRP